ncbi:MAG TPA: DUF2851 family protein [Chitinophagaceae bacterium]|nr:DUF2851 family protein [Chitinophagaceae bacterium]
MQEDLLQYIWQFQYFNKSELITSTGEEVQIIHTGAFNAHQGPDFINARIKIGASTWAGNVELHVHSSDWNLHHHSGDANYNNIILHVVWNDNAVIKDANGDIIPSLEIKDRVPKILLSRYEELMNAPQFIPCERLSPAPGDLQMINWKQRLAAERLLAKSKKIFSILEQTSYHWEETFWRLIAANFGLTLNSELFQQAAAALPVSILAKHKNQIHQLEALLLGTAGLLDEDFKDPYPVMLKKEFLFYQKKYGIKTIAGKLSFLRMRPANFPTIRLSQLAMLIHQSEHLFSKIKDASSVKDLKKMFRITANDYWHYHFVFDKESPCQEKTLGSKMIEGIIINTVIPSLFAYGVHHHEEEYKNKAVGWLEQIAPERNIITKGFEELGFTNKNALDSQAFIQLKNEYCDKRFCLKCAIGNSILKK